MSLRGRRGDTQSRSARSSSIDGSVVTVSSIPSIPSIEVSSSDPEEVEWGWTVPGEVHLSNDDNNVNEGGQDGKPKSASNHPTETMSVDMERQFLLLFLLAHFCALHDPTPRTFTVHVLDLFEREILGREAIDFLIQLGFIPTSTVEKQGLLTNTPTTTANFPRERNDHRDKVIHKQLSVTTEKQDTSAVFVNDHDDQQIEVSIASTAKQIDHQIIENTTELAVSTSPIANVLHSTNSAVPGVTTLHSQQTLRSLEATAIRRKLSRHESLNHSSSANRSSRGAEQSTTNNVPSVESNSDAPKTWNVEHFPLSLSRYERDFKEVCLLNSGSFGSVYRAIRELDGIEYAVKKITFDAIGYSSESIERVIREVQCLAAVNDHPNIVRYFTSWWEPTWIAGSLTARHPSKGTHRRQIKAIGNERSSIGISNASRSKTRRNGLKKHLLQIEAANMNDLSSQQSGDFWEDFPRRFEDDSCSSSSSSSSWSSDTDEDEYYDHSMNFKGEDMGPRPRRYSLGSMEEETRESHYSHELQPRGEVYDDSYVTKTASRRRRRSLKKRASSASYQYRISLYIQMQLCHPATLQDWIRERNKQIPEANHEQRIGPALEKFKQICSGLAHIHKSNVIHRDLKPANIFVSSDGTVIKIGDFGLSKQLHDIVNQQRNARAGGPTSPQTTNTKGWGSSSPETHNDAIVPLNAIIPSRVQSLVRYNSVGINLTAGVGTASYAAPEQVQSKTYGTAVDIFSLGLIFLELVSCFETEHERLHNLQQCRYQRVPEWIKQNYPDIASTILACTSPNPSERPSANELLDSTIIKSPRVDSEIFSLRRQLTEKNLELMENERTIESLRLEIDRMKQFIEKQLSSKESSDGVEDTGNEGGQREDLVVTDVLTFDD